jgi:hypothetical protein
VSQHVPCHLTRQCYCVARRNCNLTSNPARNNRMAALVVLSIHSASMRNPSKRQTNHTLTIAKCQTSTSTVTDTTTLTPLAASTTVYQSPTITLTTTTTSTSTITSTLTSITTSFAPQATYHAACAANNLVTSVSGQTIKGNSFNGGISLRDISNTAANSPYDCCAQCISQSTCAGSAFSLEQLCRARCVRPAMAESRRLSRPAMHSVLFCRRMATVHITSIHEMVS